MAPVAQAAALSWQFDNVDLTRVDFSRIKDNETLFYLLVASSFIESGADLYTSNLVDFFADDAEVAAWLSNHWEQEEMQHGRALRCYVQHVWPDFPWQAAFNDFFEEYAALCVAEELEPTKAQELAARCVVETGTSSLYRAINTCTDEPVLREITDHIRRDEVTHYKHFYHYFLRYREAQHLSRFKTFTTLARRLLELRNSDAEIALRHTLTHHNPTASDFHRQRINNEVSGLIRRNLPVDMTIKMLLKPLLLGPNMQKALQWPLQGATQLFLRMPL
ncbi:MULTISPECIES: ferritin-like domain-containing protein [Silvimonas]|uniref:ferritin-like domain-containing protein n=1 Tax=Silvimonas TaxID=300264 RepID=UPI0024B335EB|nr:MULTISPECIES: ferritin-like domain-containing protein [Silvimonas]MDR3426011.1 ferritin-like domain-containing protein [Silvimonas sp.]